MKEVKIGGQTYEVHYGQNAICALEDELGDSILDVLSRIEKGKQRFTDLRAIIWAGLLAKRRNITPEAVGAMLDSEENWLNTVAIQCMEELTKSFSKLIQINEVEEESEKND